MEERWKITVLVILIVMWIILLLGIIPLPPYSWLVLTGFTLIMYFVLTREYTTRKGNLEEVIDDMEQYMEKKAENTEIELKGVEREEVTSDEEKEDKEDKEKEQKYDFGDDVKIIKE